MSPVLSRRRFLQTSGIAAALPAAALCQVYSPAQPVGGAPIRLGLASYTFRNFTRADMIGAIEQLRVSALNAKDVKDHLPIDPAGEAAAVAEYAANNIRLHAIGAVYFTKDEDADIQSKFEYAKRAGVSVIVAGDPAPETLPRLERFVRAYDIRIAIHNHGPEDKIWHSPLDVMKAVSHLDPRIGCCMDVGHCARAGVDVVEAVHAVGPRLFNMHMKDLTDFSSKESQVAVGEGIMPVRGLFEALSAIRYEGFVDLEYEIHPENPMPGVLMSFAYMRGVLAGMGYKAQLA